MRKVMSLVASAALAASLAGCNNSADVNKTISDVQKIAVQVCAFLPTVETIANILTANAALPATAIANAICQAVVTPGGTHNERMEAPENAAVTVGNTRIAVKGEFVR